MDKQRIGIKLKRLREMQSLTQEEVSYQLGIETSLYRQFETGKRYPSDASLKMFCEFYSITEEEFLSSDFINSSLRRKMLHYIQMGVMGLLVLGYFLPFTESWTATNQLFSGFGYFWVAEVDEFILLGILLNALIVQLIIQVLIYFDIIGNAFKTIQLFITTSSMIIFYVLFLDHYVPSTMILYMVFLFLLMLVILFDMIVYPIKHDFLQDKEKTRRMFVLIANFVYGMIFVLFINNIFTYGLSGGKEEIVIMIIWAAYHIGYLCIKKTFFENRLVASVTLIIPPVLFLCVFLYFSITLNQPFDKFVSFVTLFMGLPVLILNLDYIIDILRSLFNYKEKDKV